MRLTESLIKTMFARAIHWCRVPQLNAAFLKHFKMKDIFATVQDSEGGKSWKKVSFLAYQCYEFTQLNAEQTAMKIADVLHEVWPAKDKELVQEGAAAPVLGKRKRAPREVGMDAVRAETTEDQNQAYIHAFCELWKSYANVVRLMRSKDVDEPGIDNFGKNCRDLGARWCILFQRQRCNAHYLHLLMMHGGQFMTYALQHGLTIGMLENSGVERRHQIGKLQFKKALGNCSAASRKPGGMFNNMQNFENRAVYYTIRGVNIWQFGTDMLTYALATIRAMQEKFKGVIIGNRRRDGRGWDLSERMKHVKDIYLAKVTAPAHTVRESFKEPTNESGKRTLSVEEMTTRDSHDDVWKSDAILFSEEFREQMDDLSAVLPGGEASVSDEALESAENELNMHTDSESEDGSDYESESEQSDSDRSSCVSSGDDNSDADA